MDQRTIYNEREAGLAMRPQIPTGRKRIPGVSGGGFEGVGAIGPAGTALPVGGPGIVANNYGANNYGDYVSNLPNVSDPEAGDLRHFDIDSTKTSAFDATNQLWSMMGAPPAVAAQ